MLVVSGARILSGQAFLADHSLVIDAGRIVAPPALS
jgi:hypothetical protein